MTAVDPAPAGAHVRPHVVVTSNPDPQPLPVRSVRRHLPALLTATALALGVALRLLAFTADRSLWIDEAMLALNLVERTPADLLAPLDHNQAAPTGYLLSVKAVISAFGPNESALRAVPFVGSLLGLGAFATAAFRLLPANAARLAVVLFAVSPDVVSYAGEAKQYATDAAIAAGLLAVCAPLFGEPRKPVRWLAAGAAGALAVWCSHPAVFVLGGLGVALVGRGLATRNRRDMLWSFPVAAAWLTSFAAMYALTLRHLGGNSYLTDYWAGQFLPHSAAAGPWLLDHLAGLFAEQCGFGGGLGVVGLAAALAVVGAVAMVRSEQRWVAAVVVPVLLTLAASAVGRYPFGGRLLLFLVPGLVLLVARGAEAVAERLRRSFAVASWAVAAVIVAAPLLSTIDRLKTPQRDEAIKPVLRFVHDHWQPGDRVYVYGGSGDAGAGPAFAFYGESFGIPAEAVIRGGIHRDDPAKYQDEVHSLPHGRVWLLVSHRHADEEATLRAYFTAAGEPLESVREPGAAAYCHRIP